ncbi:MAG TPA: D-alanyl-D-alanine carboxypeptidase/D-alanyl-D-alanine-endopeptidase [Kofleriaceae bacterium]|nr:D-alanyl-D-alanine carboxypeptidase/D-alanyl-D-alanine-endopeptidase [Kofleriaceae bacterium]
MTVRRLAAPLIVVVVLSWLPDVARAGERSGSRSARNPVRTTRASTRDSLRRTTTRHSSSETSTPEGRLRDELHAIWAGRILRRGVTAVHVVDSRTGEDLYSVHPDDKLNPASNVKLLSTATVLDLMGPSWRYVTRLFGPAPDAKGVARGSVYLHGDADPTLGRNGLEELAKDVARAGVKRIEGDLLLSDDVLRDTVADQSIAIRVRAGAQAGAPAVVSLDPRDSFVQVHVTATTTSSKRARLEISAESNSAPEGTEAPASGAQASPAFLVKVGGTIREGRSGTYWRSLGLRSTFTGHAMRQALRAAGVEVTGNVRLVDFEAYNKEALAAGFLPIELGRHGSQSLKDLVARVNKRSLNWLADRLLMTAGSEAVGGGPPSMEHGLEAMYRWLEESGLDRTQIVVDTGSGLSHRTKLTARQLVRVLRAAAGYRKPDAKGDKRGDRREEEHSLLDPAIYLASLAVGGVDGTLRGRFHSDALRGRVLGKTGTLNNSIALSGFVSDDSGHSLCFSIVTNGNRYDARGKVRREHEAMVAAMRRYLDDRAAQDETRRDAESDPVDPASRASQVAAARAKIGAHDAPDGDEDEAAEERQGKETSAGDAAGSSSDSSAAPESSGGESRAKGDTPAAAATP